MHEEDQDVSIPKEKRQKLSDNYDKEYDKEYDEEYDEEYGGYFSNLDWYYFYTKDFTKDELEGVHLLTYLRHPDLAKGGGKIQSHKTTQYGGNGTITQPQGHPKDIESIVESIQKSIHLEQVDLHVNSGSIGSTLTKKLNLYDFFSKCLGEVVDLTKIFITDEKEWFRNNPLLTSPDEARDRDAWVRRRDPPTIWRRLGKNFETKQENKMDLYNDYITCPEYVIYQDGTEGVGQLGFECRKILTKYSEKGKMIFLLENLIYCICKCPEKIHHLAQFRSFEDDTFTLEKSRIYANYILTNLINSFNPAKLHLQKTAFSSRLYKNTYNSWLFYRICQFYSLIQELSEGEPLIPALCDILELKSKTYHTAMSDFQSERG